MIALTQKLTDVLIRQFLNLRTKEVAQVKFNKH